MSDGKTTPEKDVDTDSWEIKDGKLRIFGGEVDLKEFMPHLDFSPPDPQTEPEQEEEEQETTPEKDDPAPEEKTEPEGKTKPEEKAAETTPVKDVEAPKEPEVPQTITEKYKFKVYGEDRELDLPKGLPKDVLSRIQAGLAADQRFKEAAALEAEVEPFRHVLKTQVFKEWLDEQVKENPELAPKAPPAPQPEDVVAYRVRARDEDFEEIRSAMEEWATSSLSSFEQKAIRTNYRVFNETYDRFARGIREARASAPPKPAPATPTAQPTDPKTREKIIQAKEVHKEAAKVEKPGVATEEDAAQARFNKHVKELHKILRTGTTAERQEAAALLLQYQIEATLQTR